MSDACQSVSAAARDSAIVVEPRLKPLGPIIRREDASLWSSAADALAASRAYAERTRVDADEAFAAERQRGHDTGYAEGAALASALLRDTQTRADAYFAKLDEELPSLVLTIIEDILGAFDPQDLLVRAVRHALARERTGTDLRLKVSPGEFEAVQAALRSDPATADVIVEPDPALGPGRCVLWSAFGNVEISIAAQLRAMRDGLAAGAQPHAGNKPAPTDERSGRDEPLGAAA